MNENMWTLNNFDTELFLAEYWQKKPLLIRNAFPGFKTVLSPEELAGLACEEGVHSRLVIEKDADEPWQLSYGPFKEEDFTSLPETHYSLLVSECEKWIPELQDLVECFNFIPRWRIDDLMISYAPEHGSVGPHIDEYDVFLIQANGRRTWSIESEIKHKPELVEGLDLAIMKEFNADQEWLMEPGDMLYLPPKIPHLGVAVGDGCMNYSVGFRAPAVSDIMDSFLLEASDKGLTDARYYDVPLTLKRNPAEIRNEDIEKFKSMIYQMLDDSAPIWADVVGKLVSDSTLSEDVETIDCDSIEQAAQQLWQKHPDSKVFYHQDEKSLRIYFNGEMQALEISDINLDFCKTLCNQYLISIADYYDMLPGDARQLFMSLIQNRALIPVLDDD
jgi:50S ribosomal protein L16 3-hydroxylase